MTIPTLLRSMLHSMLRARALFRGRARNGSKFHEKVFLSQALFFKTPILQNISQRSMLLKLGQKIFHNTSEGRGDFEEVVSGI